jgi:5-formyltetrahydrofolate cyclo-ligase
MTKSEFRTKYKSLRSQLSLDDVEELSLKIANKALELPIWGATYYHIFLPIIERNEVNTEFLLHILQGKDKSVIVPKANFKTGELIHILLQENTSLSITHYGIPEPESGIEISAEQIDVVFVPLLAFDKQGNRVGYGKGFYDRFLAKCSQNTIFVGLSFFEAEEKILHKIIDIPLHFCVTPQNLYSF